MTQCKKCGHALPPPGDPTARVVVCPACGTANDLGAANETTFAKRIEHTSPTGLEAGPDVAVPPGGARPPDRSGDSALDGATGATVNARAAASPPARPGRPNTPRSLASLIGSSLAGGRYVVQSELGAGGMGAVFLASDTRFSRRKVAVKVLSAELTNDALFVRRFKREADTLAELDHPHIVPVYDTGEEDGLHYIVMGFVAHHDGKPKTLSQFIKEVRLAGAPGLDVAVALRLMKQALAALDYAHRQDIIHRDIKPGNFLIDAAGNVRVVDFGIASTRRTLGEATLTVTGSTLGTLAYMAPEQKRDASKADLRSDLYSMGLVFYQMLTGRLPEADLSTGEVVETFTRPGQLRAGVDSCIDTVIARALRAAPEERFQSAREMLEAVETCPERPTRGDDERTSVTVAEHRTAVTLAAGKTAATPAGRTGHSPDAGTAPSTGKSKARTLAVDQLGESSDPRAAMPPRKGGRGAWTAVLVCLLLGGGGVGGYFAFQALDWGRPSQSPQIATNGRNGDLPGGKTQPPSTTTTTTHSTGSTTGSTTGTSTEPPPDPPPTGATGPRDAAEFWERVRFNKLEDAEKLLNANPSLVTTATRDGQPPLAWAVSRMNLPLLKMLLRHGANLDARDKAGQTLLHRAAEKNQIQQIYALLEAGARPDVTDDQGRTPLHAAALGNAAAAIVLLIDGDATGTLAAKKDSAGKTAAELIASEPGREDANVLFKHAEVFREIGHNNLGRVKEMLGKDPALATWTTRDGFSLLHYAATKGNSTIVRAIMETAGFSREGLNRASSPHGWTPLHVAAALGHLPVVQALIEGGASPGLADEKGLTPLHWAVARKHGTVATELLRRGADVDARAGDEEKRRTPLHEAGAGGRGEMAALLLRDGSADFRLTDATGKTARELALEAGYNQAADTIAAFEDRSLWDQFLKAVDDGNPDVVTGMLQQNAGKNLLGYARDARDQSTALLHAAEHGNEPMVLALLGGADAARLSQMLSQANAFNQSALHVAAKAGKLAVVKLLLGEPVIGRDSQAVGRRVNAKDNQGMTPLHYAVNLLHSTAPAPEKVAMVSLLLSKGADPDLANNTGRSAYDLALAPENPDAAVLAEAFVTPAVLKAIEPGGKPAEPSAAVAGARQALARIEGVKGVNYDAIVEATTLRQMQGKPPGGENLLHLAARTPGDESASLAGDLASRLTAAGLAKALNTVSRPEGLRPVHLAVASGQCPCAIVLLEAAVKKLPADELAPIVKVTFPLSTASTAPASSVRTLLGVAVEKKQHKLAEVLVAAKAHVDHTTFRAAVEGDEFDLVTAMLKAAAAQESPTAQDLAGGSYPRGGKTLPFLRLAVVERRVDWASAALEAKVKDEPLGLDKRTALHAVALASASPEAEKSAKALLEVARQLLAAFPAELTARDAHGKLPEDLAAGEVKQLFLGARAEADRAEVQRLCAQKFSNSRSSWTVTDGNGANGPTVGYIQFTKNAMRPPFAITYLTEENPTPVEGTLDVTDDGQLKMTFRRRVVVGKARSEDSGGREFQGRVAGAEGDAVTWQAGGVTLKLTKSK